MQTAYDTYPTKTDERHVLNERIHALLSLRDEKAHELKDKAAGMKDLSESMQKDVYLSDAEETVETIKAMADEMADFWLEMGRIVDSWREALDDLEALSEAPNDR